jgi:hypothetical protein
MITFKQFITENEISSQIGDWEDYSKNKNFNEHINADTAPKSNENIHDVTMKKLTAMHPVLDLRHKPAIRSLLNNPYSLSNYMEKSSAAGKSFEEHNIPELDKAVRSHILKTNTTVHVGLNNYVPPSSKEFAIKSHHIGSTDPENASENADPQGTDNIKHILRVDMNKGSKYALVGKAKDKEDPSVSNETFKNAVIIPRGGSFRSAGAIERYKDKEGNIIHVHPVEHRQ